MRPLEQTLWAIAGVMALVAAVFFFSTFFPGVGGSSAPTQTPQLKSAPATPRPTQTSTWTPSPNTSPLPVPTLEPLVLPTLPSNAILLTLAPSPERSGWLGSKELGAHWRDRNLHAGQYQGQSLLSVLQFDVKGLAPGSKVLFAALELNGRNARYLGTAGQWTLDLLDSGKTALSDDTNYTDVRQLSALTTLGSSLKPQQLGLGVTNRFVFGSNQLSILEQQVAVGAVSFRLQGPAEGGDNLFTWDAGPGAGEPTLFLVTVPASFVVVTATPTPADIFAAATLAVQQTRFAQQYGTPTAFPRSVATATPGGKELVVITSVPPPENRATATAQALYATAVAMTTGTFTPTPVNLITATPTAIYLGVGQFTPVPTLLPRVQSEVSQREYLDIPIPSGLGLKGNILFFTDRDGLRDQVWVMNPAGAVIGKLTGPLYYRIAEAYELFTPDRLNQVDVGKGPEDLWQIVMLDYQKGTLTPLIQEERGARGVGAYHPALSPTGDRMVFVSERTGYSEIYVYDFKTKITKRLTFTLSNPKWGYPPYNKHPSWSPDGRQIIFFSNAGTDPQRDRLWIMDADGGGLRVLVDDQFNNWNPIWVKR